MPAFFCCALAAFLSQQQIDHKGEAMPPMTTFIEEDWFDMARFPSRILDLDSSVSKA